ncbi:hypothetical protein JL475_24920 [Streptomyces sp. M2CJ-2]|uniref:hypothetical protein n=1 Tax=Streptomyces sp. M2CJ-2 TaxID=2803948 RepID=UPI00192893B3|nr:hypothetical protein [Streptomyces sp. M2CJ-2]MBL3669174.1 hypothetical protein [Streptomyces sp. M2CJ-2]
MQDNAEHDEGPVEEHDLDDGELSVEDEAATAHEDTDSLGGEPTDAAPDVFLDVPVLKVDQIDLDVEDLRAHVSLQAEVLDLLKLNVGADVALGRVHLGISGVEAQAQLKVRLDNVVTIVNRVLTTLDRNPEIVQELARGVGSAVQDVGGGARQAVGELGTGAGRAVEDVGRGAGSAVQDVGRGAGDAVDDVGRGAGRAVQDVGGGAGRAVEDVGAGASRAVGDVGENAGDTAEAAGDIAEAAGGTAQKAAEDIKDVTGTAGGTAGRTRPAGSSTSHRPAGGDRDRTARSKSGTRPRRARGEDGKEAPRPARRTTQRRDEPP